MHLLQVYFLCRLHLCAVNVITSSFLRTLHIVHSPVCSDCIIHVLFIGATFSDNVRKVRIELNILSLSFPAVATTWKEFVKEERDKRCENSNNIQNSKFEGILKDFISRYIEVIPNCDTDQDCCRQHHVGERPSSPEPNIGYVYSSFY